MTTAILLAGGLGTRLAPLTGDCPKPLLPVRGEPMIGQVLRRLAAAGITDVVISTGHLADQFPAVLGDGSRYGVRLRYAVEQPARGTGGALAAMTATGPAGTASDPVLVLNADEHGSHDLPAQLAATAAQSWDGSLHVRSVADRSAFGAVEVGPEGAVTSFVEKPAVGGPGLANAGCYVFNSAALQRISTYIDESRASDPARWSLSLERDVLPRLISDGTRLLAVRDESPGVDLGTIEAYRAAGGDR